MFKNLKYELKSDKFAIASIIFLLIISLLSIFAFLLPNDPDEINMANTLASPSLSHIFGTDDFGRDYFTRAIYGGRVSLTVGILAMVISTFVGIVIGTVSGYFGKIVDNIIMRFVDIVSSIPWMILVTIISIFLTPGLNAIIIVIGFFTWMRIARLVRAETLSLKEREYVLYSKASGQSAFNIIVKHIIPGVFPTIIVSATIGISSAIMIESSLSFLGLGVQQPMSSWGSMLQTAQANLGQAPYMSIFPGLLIVFTIFSFNKIGDILRVLVEPKSGTK